jgi:hypothetical protein
VTFFRLAYGGRHGNHDITQWSCCLPHQLRHIRFTRRERQHVRASIFVSKLTIQPAHSPVTDERQTQISRRFPHLIQHSLRQAREAGSINRHGAEVGLEKDGH